MSVGNHIDYVEFAAKDMAATKKFFQDVFGWVFTDFGSDYTAFKDSGVEGGFYQADLVNKAQQGGALVVLYSPDLEATQAKVEEHGGTVVRPVFSFPGGRRFHFTEPSGNELAVWSDKE